MLSNKYVCFNALLTVNLPQNSILSILRLYWMNLISVTLRAIFAEGILSFLIVASIQKLPAASVLTDINFPMKGRKGMVDWARNSEDRVVIPKSIFTPMSSKGNREK